MTRKDYILIAKTIKELPTDGDNDIKITISNMFATALSSTNAAFDRTRFLHTCGIETEL